MALSDNMHTLAEDFPLGSQSASTNLLAFRNWFVCGHTSQHDCRPRIAGRRERGTIWGTTEWLNVVSCFGSKQPNQNQKMISGQEHTRPDDK